MASVHLEPLPAIAGQSPADVAERFRDLPGLVLLESAAPGRADRWSWLSADPLAVVAETPGAGDRWDPWTLPRALLARLAPDQPGHLPFAGGLIGYLGYDVGRRLVRALSTAMAGDEVPELRLGLHDWVVAWDHWTGAAWLAGRAVDGDDARLARRREDVRRRLDRRPNGEQRKPDDAPDASALQFVSNIDRDAFALMVGAVRAHIADGHVYQVNIARRLRAPYAGDPWPLYRRLRAGDPARFAVYLAIDGGAKAEGDGGGRAILSASPEPFLRLDRDGLLRSDPIKGTRPRGRDATEDRQLACELLGSAKDRAENVMIVDVLRNDLGRVSEPGSVRVPRLCRLERTRAVQHLVSTVTGRLLPGRDPFDVLEAAFPGGSVTGAPKVRAMQVIDELEPLPRGPYTGAAGWIGPDGAMAMSILIRTFVADGRSLSLHVGGGITRRSDAALEWAETEAKARGPLSAIGAVEVGHRT
jgi:para-aminobenzoate synthetase component 1